MLLLALWERRLTVAAAFVLRYSLATIFVGYGIYKFWPAEAAAIAPLTQHSLLMFWLNPTFGVQGASNLIGAVEIVIAALIALHVPFPRLSAVGSGMAAFALVNTISFLATTPGMPITSTDAGFLLKDVTLLGAALWTAAESLRAAYPAAALDAPAAVSRSS